MIIKAVEVICTVLLLRGRGDSKGRCVGLATSRGVCILYMKKLHQDRHSTQGWKVHELVCDARRVWYSHACFLLLDDSHMLMYRAQLSE